MKIGAYGGRRTNSSRGVRDCLDQRDQRSVPAAGRAVVGGTRLPKAQSAHELVGNGGSAAVGHSMAQGRLPRVDSAQELNRQLQLPASRQGYTGNRVPASADAVPGARKQLLPSPEPGHYRPPVSADAVQGNRVRNGADVGPSETLMGATNLGATLKRDRGREQRSISEQPQSDALPQISGSRGNSFYNDPAPGRRARSDGPLTRIQSGGAQSSGQARSSEKAVSSVSKFAEPNLQFRDYMEDRYVSIDPFMAGEVGTDRWGFFAVYDGHGGSEAADHVEKELHEVLITELRAVIREQRKPTLPDEAVADALTRVFRKVDDQLRVMGCCHLGCTATVCLVQRSGSGVKIHTANVGDSRAISVDHKNSRRLTQDHRATDPAEVQRVQKEGGFCSRGRVSGVLAVSRALGDHALKSGGVSWRPSVSVHDASGDIALVIASDGLWDTLEDSDVRATVNQKWKEGSTDVVAKRLVQDAQRLGSTDNIACLVAWF